VNRAVLALVLATPLAAHADNAQRANELFGQAQQKYEAGEYRAAIRLFESAYVLVHDPVYLFNIAQSYRKLFDCIPSAQYYERYLAEATDVDQAQKDRVQGWLKELAPCVTDHKSAAQFEARPKPDQPSIVKPVVREHPGRGLRIGGLALVGAGTVGLVVGALYTKRGSDLEGELAETCAMGCSWTAVEEDKERDAKQANTRAAVAWIAGGAAIAGGVTLYLLGRSRRIAAERVVIVPTATGAAVSARFDF
jgi:hypothetical protein